MNKSIRWETGLHKNFAPIIILIICISGPIRIFAQTAQISEKLIPLVVYPFSDPDPVPITGKFYPYFRFDGYTDKGAVQNVKMVEMENDYIKLWVTPEIGGKIWGAVEKSTGKAFIYYNHVVKFRDVAMRGPWTSGGIEINFGVIGHAPTSSSPVDYLLRKNDDGSVSCFVSAIDLASRTRWSVEVNLPKDKAWFTTRSVWDNPTPLDQSYYHWMNVGVKTAGNLEYAFPGNYFLGHDGKPSAWPVDKQDRKINFYESNNFGSYKSYHVFGEPSGFYGAYWHDDDFGFGHYSTYDEKPGKKVWIWGLSGEGMIWEKLLTDHDGQYTEIQSGRLFNQAAGESSFTPFKNRGFAAGSTDEWVEHWFPVKGTKGLKTGEPLGSVNLEQMGENVNLWFCPNETVNGKLEVRNGQQILSSIDIHSKPMQSISQTIEYKGDFKKLTVWFNNSLLYDANREKYELKRPIESPAGFNWQTAYGHFLNGKEFERQRLYKNATEEYEKSLKIEPWFVPALTGMANLCYRKTDSAESFDYSLKALSIDTYDSGANMIYGLSGLALGDTTSAIDGFSIASSEVSQRSAAYNALASVFMSKGEFSKALSYAEKSLLFNQEGSDAIQLKVLAFRKLGNQKESDDQLNKLEEKDPLNHFIRFERYILNPTDQNKNLVKKYVTNELPHETYLEYALWYLKNGLRDDAMKILALAPENHPVVLLWEAYLAHLSGKEQQASDLLAKSLLINPQFVFPFRTEILKPLEWAQEQSDDWKIKYYSGLVYFNAGKDKKGMELWKSCGNKPDFYPFYIARASLPGVESTRTVSDMEKALILSKNDWRAGLYALKYYQDKDNLVKAEELAKSYYAKYPKNYYLGLHYAKILELRNQYTLCLQLLQNIQVLPNEGATDGLTIWRNANLGMALDLMKTGKYRKALENIEKARLYPANLGVGKPYETNELLANFIALQCYKKLNEKLLAQRIEDKLIDNTGKSEPPSDMNIFLTSLILKEKGEKPKADQLMKVGFVKADSSKIIEWYKAIYADNREEAKTLAKEMNTSDRNFFILNRIFNNPEPNHSQH